LTYYFKENMKQREEIASYSLGGFAVFATLGNDGMRDGGCIVIGPGGVFIANFALSELGDAMTLVDRLDAFLNKSSQEAVVSCPELHDVLVEKKAWEDAMDQQEHTDEKKYTMKQEALKKYFKEIARDIKISIENRNSPEPEEGTGMKWS